MVGDPTTQDNISIWLVWTVRQRIKLALCHVHSQSLSFCLPLEITMIYDEDRNLVIFDNFHQGQCHGHWSSWWFLSPLKLSKVRGIVIESQKDCYWKSEGLQWKRRRNPFVIPPRVQSTERPQGHTRTMISRVFPILIVTHWDGFGIWFCKEKHQLNQVLSLQQQRTQGNGNQRYIGNWHGQHGKCQMINTNEISLPENGCHFCLLQIIEIDWQTFFWQRKKKYTCKRIFLTQIGCICHFCESFWVFWILEWQNCTTPPVCVVFGR